MATASRAVPAPLPSEDESLAERLQAASWQVSSLLGQSLQLPQPLVLHFVADGLLEGSTGCNLLAAQYRLDGQALQTMGLRRTQRPCNAQAAEQQEALMRVLAGLRSYAFDAAGHLVLYSTEGTLVAIARSP